MLQITEKQILTESSELLYDRPFTEELLRRDWEITGGDWSVRDSWLTGYYKENAGGLLYLNRSFPGDILMDFYGRTVPPCVNDLNFSFCTEGWDKKTNDAGRGYIAGLGGWWEGKTGIEHYPSRSPWAGTPLFSVEAGRVYHIQTGAVGGHCFIFVDGRLIVELLDPLYSEFRELGRVGFGAYCSHVQFKDFKLYRPAWKTVSMTYTPRL